MKKLLFLLTLILLLVLTGCGGEEYTVRFVYGDGREDLVMSVRSGDELFRPSASEETLVFAGWFTDAELTRPYLSRYVDEDITLYARFIPKGEYAVTYIYDNGDPSTTVLMSGTLFEPISPTREGYVFTGWKDAASGEAYRFGMPLSRDHTVLVATWRETSEGVRLVVHPENGSDDYALTYNYSACPEEPNAPSGEGSFLGWFADPSCKMPYDFDAPLTKDTHIYASWGIDYKKLAEAAVNKLVPATVEITTTRKSIVYSAISTGSGVIFFEDSYYYYILTNEHVVRDESGYPLTTVSVTDAYGYSYEADRLAMSSVYDLAALRVRKGDKLLAVADVADADPTVGDFVISVGCPGGLNNAVTYGEIKRYDSFTVNGAMVAFKVGTHDAFIKNGSSGGGLFNERFELVGINFAASTDPSGEFSEAAFVQISRVIEFLTANSLPINK